MRRRLPSAVFALLIVAPLVTLSAGTLPPSQRVVEAAPVATAPFEHTWRRTDQPVAAGQVSRTWMWGPEAFTEGFDEEYAESPGGVRTVQYFDKSRMEITSPDGDPNSIWYVTNGLLVVELVTGNLQTGNNAFEQRQPAQFNVAGDTDDPNGPTYATFNSLRSAPPLADGALVTQRLDRAGNVTDDPALAAMNVTAAHRVTVPNLDHQVASPFWSFMTSSGPVWENNQLITAALFIDPFYATGLPISEAYWATVRVGGTAKDVLMQCFERRCLTYTPDNAPEWRIEMGNVGQHYHAWRYPVTNVEPGPSVLANNLADAVTSAATLQQRVDALVDIAAALNIAVVDGAGTMVSPGRIRGDGDYYLYTAEVEMLASALGRGQTQTLGDLAMALTAMELLPEGETLDPAVLHQALLAAADTARDQPANERALPLLIARQRGLAQSSPYDLFGDPVLDAIALDGLQYWLIMLDIVLPLIDAELPLEAVDANFVANTNGILKPAPLADPCHIVPHAGQEIWHFGVTIAELLHRLPHAIGRVLPIISGIHAAMLAFSVNVKGLQNRIETHYGPPDGHYAHAGEQMRFQIKVDMLDDLGALLINCGWIIGATLPPKGPIPGVSVLWEWDDLAEHGQIFCGNACPSTGAGGLAIDATDAAGIATLTFTPKNEPDPGEGPIIEKQGIVTGVALYQSKFSNFLGSYVQFLVPKSDAARWVVTYHKPPSYIVRITGDSNLAAAGGGFEVRNTESTVWEINIPAAALEAPFNSPEAPDFYAVGGGESMMHGQGGYCADSWSEGWGGDIPITSVSNVGDERYVTLDWQALPTFSFSFTNCVDEFIGTAKVDPLASAIGNIMVLTFPSGISLDKSGPQTVPVPLPSPSTGITEWDVTVTVEVTKAPPSLP